MAEVRKHRTSSNPIMEQIARAMGDPVRPVAPGSAPEPKKSAPGVRHDIFTTATTGFTIPAPARPDTPTEDDHIE